MKLQFNKEKQNFLILDNKETNFEYINPQKKQEAKKRAEIARKIETLKLEAAKKEE